jgi:hypothetical protein
MSHEDVLDVIRRRPFVPFRLVTTDRTTYEIRHPEMLMPGRRTVTIGLPDDPATPAYTRQVIVSMLHVQRLEPSDAAPASGQPGNGAS